MLIRRTALTLMAAFAVLTAPMAMAEVKVAVVDVQTAILNSEEAKRLLSQIQEEFAAEEEEIVQIQSEAAAIMERMQKDADVISDAEKRRMQGQIESLNNDFVYERQKLQRAIEQRQGELFSGMNQRVQKAIEELVLAEDYDLIIPRQAALYVGDLYNITRKVTEKLNELDPQRTAGR